MLAAIIILGLVGAVTGFFAKQFLSLRLDQRQAAALGAVGAIVGGALVRLLLPLAATLAGALIGAAILIWFVERWRNRFG